MPNLLALRHSSDTDSTTPLQLMSCGVKSRWVKCRYQEPLWLQRLMRDMTMVPTGSKHRELNTMKALSIFVRVSKWHPGHGRILDRCIRLTCQVFSTV